MNLISQDDNLSTIPEQANTNKKPFKKYELDKSFDESEHNHSKSQILIKHYETESHAPIKLKYSSPNWRDKNSVNPQKKQIFQNKFFIKKDM